MVSGSPCMCIRHMAKPVPAADSSAPGRRKPRTSFSRPAPNLPDAVMMLGVLVSTETITSMRLTIASTAVSTRSDSSDSATGAAPGRVDSPPTSRISAPELHISSARRNTASI